MMRAMFAAISGLQVHQTMLDVAANDIANVNTVGFKGETTAFQDALSQLQRGASGPSGTQGGTNAVQIGLGVQLGAIENQMGAGAPQQTGNPLDVAISGDGFFRVGPSSVVGTGAGYSYTRAGNFGLDSAGNLVTQSGDFVMGYNVGGTTEQIINVPTTGKDVAIGADGIVSYVDSAGAVQQAGQISLTKFPNPGGLQRTAGNLFMQSNNSGTAVNSVPNNAANGMGSLASGQLEMSNVDLASEFTTMITAQRGYEANSRVISTADQVLENLVNIGR